MKNNLKDKINYYLDYCENVKMMTPMTIRGKRWALNYFLKFVGDKKINLISNEDFNKWIKALKEDGVKNNTINDYVQKIVAMLRFYIEMGDKVEVKIPLIPTLKGEPRRKNYYSKETIYEVIDNSNEISSLMIRISFDTGMRIAELSRLKLSDFSGKKIHYIGKGRIWHDTWIRDETYKKLLDYIKSYGVKNYLWFEKDPNKPLCQQVVARYMSDAFIECGHNDFHPHALRHSFAVNLQRQGASVIEIQHMIGHLHLKTTEEYLHGFEEDKMANLFEKYA